MTNRQKLYVTTGLVLGLFLSLVKYSMVGGFGLIPFLGEFLCLVSLAS